MRAAKDELEAIAEIRKVIMIKRRDAQARLGEAEAELNHYAKLDGFARILLDEARERLEKLTRDQQQ